MPDSSKSAQSNLIEKISVVELNSNPDLYSKSKVIDIPFGKLNILAEGISTKNKDSKYDKPCEDYIICDAKKGIFILMDGATRYVKTGGTYPSPSPAAEAAALFAESAHSFLSTRSQPNLSIPNFLLEAVKTANFAIKEYNQRSNYGQDSLEKDYANACGIVCLIRNNTLHYAYLADPQGFLIRDNMPLQFTETQTEFIDNLEKQSKNEPDFDFIAFRRDVCTKIRNRRNHENAFGSFTGEEEALDLLEMGSIALKAKDRILLTSDGLLPLLKSQPQIVLSEDYEFYIRETEEVEKSLGIRSDDKSIIAIKMES